MEPIPLILPTGSTVGRDGQDANARLINGYAEQLGKDGKASYAIYGAPGLKRWDSGDFSGSARQMIELDNNNLIAVLGNEIVSFDQTGSPTLLATIVGSSRVTMARNNAATPQIIIVTGAKQVFSLVGGVLTAVNDADLPAPESVTYCAGFHVYGILDGRIFASDLEDGTSIAADAFGYARGESSNLVRVFENSRFLYVFKNKSTEIWQPDPSLANQPFPFSPVQQNIDIGLGAKFSVSPLQRGLAWVDDERIVRLGRDGGAARISNHTIERLLEDLTTAQLAETHAFTVTHQGHEDYVLSSPQWTRVFDSLTNQWYERKTQGQANWRATGHAFFNAQHIISNDTDGKLYALDSKTYTDAGELQIMEIWCAHSHRFPDAMQVNALEIDLIAGTGLSTSDDHNADPKLMIDYSDDGGHTFKGERQVSVGKIGKRRKTIRTNRWGRVDEKGRIWRFRASASVPWGIMGAALRGEPLNKGR